MSNVFAHGALRLYILNLLQAEPMHGYEIMRALERRFGGTYQPSPGTIYPRLAKLESEGLVSRVADGRRTSYVITDNGRHELVNRKQELDSLESEIGDSVRRLADEVRGGVEQAMRSLRADLAAAQRDTPSAPPRTATAGNPKMAQRMLVHDLDIALTRFRSGVRTVARVARVDAAAADAIRAELDASFLRIQAILQPVSGAAERKSAQAEDGD